MRAIPIACLILASVAASSQAPEESFAPDLSPEPRVLSSSYRLKLDIPMFGSVGKAACDADGVIVFNIGMRIGEKGPFLSVQSDGKHVLYVLPEEAKARGEIVWAIAPEGTFYVLHQSFKLDKYKLLWFKADGSLAGSSSLDVPAGISIQNMAILDNGTAYVRGFRATGDPLEKPRSGYGALFDAAGKAMHDLSLDAPQADLKALQQHPLDGDVVAGQDGRFYILGAANVLVLNQSGDVEKELKFKKPVPDAVASRVDYSNGAISILFAIPHPKPGLATEIEERALLLDAQTGQKRGDYIFDPATSGSVLCFNARDGYTLMAREGRMAAFDIVPIR